MSRGVINVVKRLQKLKTKFISMRTSVRKYIWLSWILIFRCICSIFGLIVSYDIEVHPFAFQKLFNAVYKY